MNYQIVVEKGESSGSFGAYVPDLPGCVAVGSTRAQVLSRIRSAIAMHLEGMLEDGVRPPKPSAPEFVTVTEIPSSAETVFRVESITPRMKQLLAVATVNGNARSSKSTAVSGSPRDGVAKKAVKRGPRRASRRK